MDNVLNEEERKKLRELFSGSPEARAMRWISGSYDDVKHHPSPITKLLALANRSFDVSSMCGIEMWAHNGTRPDWHIDKDETLYQTSGNLAYPICSIVYYVEVDELKDGMFMTETINITPVNNRAIIFAPGIMHGVQPYEGTRISLAVNPWSTKPIGY